MKLKLFFSLGLLSALVLSSCNRSGQEIYKLVPDNVAVVASFSPGKLMEKADATDLEFMKNALEDKEFNKLLFENPGVSGINVNSNSCVFVSGNEERYLGVIMPLKSKKVFELFLGKLSEEYKVDFKIEQADKFSYSVKDDNVLAWNKSVVIHLTRIKGMSEVSILDKLAELFSLEPENCILSEKDFKSFLSEQKDLNIWLTSNQLANLAGSNMGMMSMLGGINNNYAHIFLEFGKGEIKLSSNLILNSDFKKNFDKYNIIDLNAEKGILEMLPADNLVLVGNFRLNPDKLIDLKNTIGSGNHDFFLDFEKEKGKTTEQVLKSIQGSLAFTINGIMPVKESTNENSDTLSREKRTPVIFGALQLNDETFFNEFIKFVNQKEILKAKNGYYVIHSEDEQPFYLGLKNNIILLTNEEKYMMEIMDGGKLKNNLMGLELSKTLVDNPICFYLNLDKDSYTETVKQYFDEEMDKSFAKGMSGFGNSLKSLTISGNLEKSELRIELKDKSVNSLHAFLQALDH